MKSIKSSIQTRTLTCEICGPQLVSWEWRCSGEIEVTCPTCGKGLAVKVKTIRAELHENGWKAVRRVLWGR